MLASESPRQIEHFAGQQGDPGLPFIILQNSFVTQRAFPLSFKHIVGARIRSGARMVLPTHVEAKWLCIAEGIGGMGGLLKHTPFSTVLWDLVE